MKTLKDFLSSLDHSYDFLSINLSIDGDIITVVAGDDKLSSDDEWDIMDFAENHNSGFRVCDECGKPFWGGYTDNFDMYCCEYHFNGYMDKNYPDGWRINETGEPGENDGFYDAIGSNSEWYDTGIKAAKAYNTTVSVYDPYNRTEAHNLSVLSSDYDIAIISNVLNVIDTDTERANVLNLASSKANTILITVYEGDGSGVGKATKDDCWQENRKTSDYVSEIQTVLTNYTVSRYGKLIVARKDV